MEQTTPQGGTGGQFTRDDVARIVVSALNQVLAKLSTQNHAEGVAVFPGGEGVLLVDVVMRDLSINDTWGMLTTIPPADPQPMDSLD